MNEENPMLPPIPTQEELLARGFTPKMADDLIELCKIMNDLSERDRQAVLALMASQYIDSTIVRSDEERRTTPFKANPDVSLS
jgi:hypothetical protein